MSSLDGLSFNRLHNALLGYGGPTLLVIPSADSDAIFGAITASPWKESKDYYGSAEDCFLYQLSPVLTVCHPSRRGQNFMFCHSSQSQSHRGSAPRGIGFGGTATQSPRLFLDESFCGCFVSCQDNTFETGYLLPLTDSFFSKNLFQHRSNRSLVLRRQSGGIGCTGRTETRSLHTGSPSVPRTPGR